MREILVCVTFREFDGGTNAKIQRKFLEGLQRQDYRNFKLIVTNYREKHVKDELDKTGLPYEFHQSEKDCLCSWTEVIQNSFQYLKPGHNIILWTNADNVFEPNLFSEIVRNFESGSGGTSHPFIPYATLEDYERNQPVYACDEIKYFKHKRNTYKNKWVRSFYQLDPNYWVPDTVYIDGDLFLDANNRNLFLEHEFGSRWPGQAQTLVLAFFANRLKNLIYRSKIASISSVLAETPTIKEMAGTKSMSESGAIRMWYEHYARENQRGQETLIRFCEARDIPKRFILECHPLGKLNQHREYKVVGRVDQKLLFWAYLSYWTLYHSGLFRISRGKRGF